MEYCSDIKKKKLPFVTAWIDLETIILSEISQSEKDKYNIMWFHLYVESDEQNRNRGTDTWIRLTDVRGAGVGGLDEKR